MGGSETTPQPAPTTPQPAPAPAHQIPARQAPHRGPARPAPRPGPTRLALVAPPRTPAQPVRVEPVARWAARAARPARCKPDEPVTNRNGERNPARKAARNRAAFGLRETHESRRSVLAAIVANLAIAAMKFIAAALSGSSVMLAEAIHSLVEMGDGVLRWWWPCWSSPSAGRCPCTKALRVSTKVARGARARGRTPCWAAPPIGSRDA